MADVSAFRAYRYDLGSIGTLADVIAPPYDVIDQDLQASLYERSPCNIVRLILNREEADDTPGRNRYTRAGQFLRDWKESGVLRQDSARSLYVYHHEFENRGECLVRRGFFARVRLEPLDQGAIFAHEETMPGPKADRLSLFRAMRMNLSPVFGLYPDETGQVQAQLDKVITRTLPLEAADHLGTVHRFWAVSDQATISTVVGLMGTKPIFIADGHHRYETALKYAEESHQPGQHCPTSADFVLMSLTGMSDPGLVIQPTHRLVANLPKMTSKEVTGKLGRTFEVRTVGTGAQAARELSDTIEADGSQRVLGLGLSIDQSWHLARFKGDERTMQQLAPEHGERWRGLAVSLLHLHVLGECLTPISGEPELRYVHLLEEAIASVEARECQLAVLVPPATVGDVAAIAERREKMPPKSTYFYPKLASGLVLNPLT
jgi:uncharacterized protein (DUF1015 family)